jgi:hypothetical protein
MAHERAALDMVALLDDQIARGELAEDEDQLRWTDFVQLVSQFL